jgi:uncharacterized MAPEG superfamily protein
MTIIITCSIIAAALTYLTKIPVAYAMNKLDGYDNRHPRDQQTRLTGFGARALAAHQNSFESLVIFALAIAIVMATQTFTATTETLAITYIIARVLYSLFYYLNWHIIRSTTWFIGLASPIAMMVVCI